MPHLPWLLAPAPRPPFLGSDVAGKEVPAGSTAQPGRGARAVPLRVPEWSLPPCERSEQSGVVASPAWSCLRGHCPPGCPWGCDLGAGGHCSWTHSLDGATRGVAPPGCPSQGHRHGPHACASRCEACAQRSSERRRPLGWRREGSEGGGAARGAWWSPGCRPGWGHVCEVCGPACGGRGGPAR